MKAARLNFAMKSKISNYLTRIFRTSFISELTEADIESALTPIHMIVFAVY